jgi:hypothetical protein
MKKLIFIIFVFISITPAFSFSFNNSVGAAFESDEVIVNVADNCSNLAITNTELLSIVKDSLDQYWNTVSTSKLVLKLGSLSTMSSVFLTDIICTVSGENCIPNTDLTVASGILISCNTNLAGNFSNSSSIQAVTLPNNIVNSTLTGSLLLINDHVSNTFQNKSRGQMVSIIAHELGHAIGLGHSPVEDSLMYFTLVPVRDRLGFDDIDGVTYLYPKSQPISCGTIKNINNNGSDNMTLASVFFLLCLYLIQSYRNESPRFS